MPGVVREVHLENELDDKVYANTQHSEPYYDIAEAIPHYLSRKLQYKAVGKPWKCSGFVHQGMTALNIALVPLIRGRHDWHAPVICSNDN